MVNKPRLGYEDGHSAKRWEGVHANEIFVYAVTGVQEWSQQTTRGRSP